MKILITGATGFIGKALVNRLLEKKYDVIVLSRNIDKARNIFPNPHVTIAQWDSRTSQGWLHYADGAYAIINLAGESITGLWTKNKKHKILQSRLMRHKRHH